MVLNENVMPKCTDCKKLQNGEYLEDLQLLNWDNERKVFCSEFDARNKKNSEGGEVPTIIIRPIQTINLSHSLFSPKELLPLQ